MSKLKKVAITLAVILFILTNIKYSLGVTGKITAETIRIRAEATTDSKIIEIGNAGEKVDIVGLEGDWYKVSFKGKTGYIYKDYLTPDGEVKTSDKTNENSSETNQTPEASTTPETSTAPEATPSETPTQTPTETTNDKAMELGNVVNKETSAYLLPNFTSTKIEKVNKDQEIKLITTMANWAKIEINQKEAWIPKTFLMKEVSVETTKPTEQQPEETTETQPETQQPEQTTQPAVNKAGYISSNASAHFRSGPSTSSQSLGKLPKNTKITITGEENGWYKVSYNGKEGYISKSLVTEGEPPATTSSRSQEEPRSATTTTQASSNNVVQVAESYAGSRYVSGGSSPSGFDCSGFTQYVYGKCGVTLSRTSYTQATQGTAVNKSELQPGDLLLFHYYGSSSIGHVGIYVGNGKFIHAANSNRGVVYDSIESGYYADNYAGARRL